MDERTRRVWTGEQDLLLTRLQYEVLVYLAQRAGHVVSYQELWREVWKHTSPLDDGAQQTVRQTLKRLKRKLGAGFLYTVRDVGLWMDDGNLEIQS